MASWQYDLARRAITGIGRKMSDSFKRKQSESHSGPKNPMFGKKHSNCTRELQRQGTLRHYAKLKEARI